MGGIDVSFSFFLFFIIAIFSITAFGLLRLIACNIIKQQVVNCDF